MTNSPEFFNFYQNISQAFSVSNTPEHAVHPQLLLWNDELHNALGIPLDTKESDIEQYLVGNKALSDLPPTALAYSGHQFGHFNPLLGDGRAHYLASFKSSKPGIVNKSYDLQLKGSGATNFSRGGDGFCALGPAVREFVMSEAIAALNVPTTHCLSVVTTGSQVYRQQHLPGAVVCRVASSHIRVGSFQFLALNNDVEGLRTLMELAIARHFPETVPQSNAGSDDERVLAFLNAVCDGQIALIIEWLRVGFIHGVMNTDNCLVSGETIDYGPCAMMESFAFDTVFSSIDKQGRYAFGNQPNMANWNCARLAESLITLMNCDEDKAIERLSQTLNSFSTNFDLAYQAMWAKKLGILQWHADKDSTLLNELFVLMKKHKLDYTNTFAALTVSVKNLNITNFVVPSVLSQWYVKWQERINEYNCEDVFAVMKKANPALIPRNHLVEEVIKEFYELGTSPLWQEWQSLLVKPYEYTVYDEKFTTIADDKPYQTFCGT